MNKIIAVVVTYNRLKTLIRSIDAISNQTQPVDEIIIINNGDSFDISLFPKEYQKRITIIKPSSNIGGAGGFSLGIQKSIDRSADFVWVMDDDAIANKTTLHHLYICFKKFSVFLPVGFVCSNVKWTDGSICEMNQPAVRWDWARWFDENEHTINIESCSFVSVLIPRNVILEKGLPVSDFFIWCDDTEYTRRISSTHVGLCNLSSEVVHEVIQNLGVNFSLVNEASLWKYKYGARNQVAMERKKSFIHALLASIKITRSVLSGSAPRRIQSEVVFACIKGMFWNYKIPKTEFIN